MEQHHVLDEDALFEMAELFKVFGDSTRIRILYALFQSELSVTDICEELGMSISASSAEAGQAGELPPCGQASLLRIGG